MYSSNVTYFFEEAGLSVNYAFDMNIVSTCLGFVGMFIGWYLMSFVGRRTMLVTGLGMQSIVTFTLGFMSLASHTKFRMEI